MTNTEEIVIEFGKTTVLPKVLPNEDTDQVNATWTFNDKDVSNTVPHEKGFEIKDPNFMNSGIYKCKYGEEVTKTYKVTVYDHLFGDKSLGVRITLTSAESEEKPDMLNHKQSKEDGSNVTDESVSDYSDKTDDISEDAYTMKATPRGIAVILHIMEFANLNDLPGMKTHDTEQCIQALTNLGFEIRECKVAKRKNVMSYLKQVAAEDHSRYDCFVLFVGSHGANGLIACSDYQPHSKAGMISYSELLHIFLDVKGLKSKPKLLFFDSCRQYSLSDSTDEIPIKSFNNKEEIKDHYRHVLIGYATIIGTSAYQGKNGGFYTKHLTTCLNEYASNCPLSGIMEKVHKRLKVQTAICESTLEKSLHFFLKQ